MKIIFSVDVLLPKVARCVSLVNTKNSLPILGNLLIETNDLQGDIVITASDGETWLSYKSEVIETDKNVSLCINASDIYKALSNLKGKNIEMVIDESSHTIKCSHEKGHFQLPFDDSVEYPRATIIDDDKEETATMILGGSHILRSLEKAGFAVANDELRPILSGVHFDFFDYGMVSVATDGHKLSKFTDKEINSARVDGDLSPNGFTLPKKPATTLMNILSGYDGNVKFVFNNSAVCVNNSDFKLTTRLLEGKYPNYDAVIQKENDIVVTILKSDFISALKRVMPMSNTNSELVSVKLSMGLLTLAAVDFDFSKSANENIECDYSGVEFAIGFKGSNMLAIAQNIDGDNIKIALKDPSRAALFTPLNNNGETTEYVSLLMPMLI